MYVFPSVSKSVPVSATVRLAAVEEGVLGVRNLIQPNDASSLFLTVNSDPKSASVHYHHTSHSESLVVGEGR